VLGLAAVVITSLATFAAVHSTSQEADAQTGAYELTTLCLERSTGVYKGSFTGSCPAGHQLLPLPDSYPLTLCASAYDRHLRKPLLNGQCQAPSLARIELPSPTPVNVCYVYATTRLRLPNPDGTCGTGVAGGRLVFFASGFNPTADTYRTLGNVDIAVPANAGVLSNDGGFGTSVTAFDTSGTAGSVGVNPDGSFTYLPPAPSPSAFSGNDSFSYTVEDSYGEAAVVTVTLQVLTPAVWFVDTDTDATTNDGRRETPFASLSDVNNIADPDLEGDVIFLYESINPYEGGLVLEDAQTLVGQEVSLLEILTTVIADGSALAGVEATTVPPFMVLPPADPSGDVPLLINVDSEFPLSMANDTMAAGVFVESNETAAVSAQDVVNTTLDRMDITGGDSTENFSDGQIGVFSSNTNMTIIDSVIRGGNVVDEMNDVSSLQGSFDTIGGHGIESTNSELTVIGSTIQGGDGAAVTPLSSGMGRALQGCCDGSAGGYGISSSISDITISDDSFVAGGDGGFVGDGGFGIANDILGPFSASALQGVEPLPVPFVRVSGSTVEGGQGGESEGAFDDGGDGGAGISGFFIIIEVLDDSSVSGGDGGDADDANGGYGGAGVEWNPITAVPFTGSSALQGPPLPEPTGPAVTVSNDSDVTGGDGGDGFEIGGDGGPGIFLGIIDNSSGSNTESSLAGPLPDEFTIMVVDGALVSGGNGGVGESDEGGWGAPGIEIFSLFLDGLSASESHLQGTIPALISQVIDSEVFGGGGGLGGDFGGLGGDGINLGSPLIESGETGNGSMLQGDLLPFEIALEVSGSDIAGGPGASGDEAGWGGSGISTFPFGFFLASEQRERASSLQGPPFPVGPSSIDVNASEISGGPGGDGDFGDGGFGIIGFLADIVVDEGTTINGADGGDGDIGGLGGEGITLLESDLIVSGNSQINGGDGGSGTSFGFAAPGGDGIFGEDSHVEISDSTATGGRGGDGEGTDAERGGHGVHLGFCLCTLIADTATITGGNGGTSALIGGDGGEGIIIEDDDAIVTNSTVTGGSAGAGTVENGVGASAFFFEQFDDLDYVLDIQTNILTGGTGATGQAPSLHVEQDGTGSVCVNATGNTPSGIFFLDNSLASGVLAITQIDIDALSAANNGVSVTAFDPITTECVIVS
jgi:hypothetical protein